MILAYILIFTFIGSIASLAGSFFLLIRRNITESFSSYLISFAAGVLLAVAFLDLLPEAQDAAGELNFFIPTLAGFIIFFFAERYVRLFHHHHQHGEKTPTALVLIGDGVHNFVDGVAITASFLTSIPLGITTSLAVAAHEIPQEIADMGILLANKLSKTKALTYNFLAHLTSILGGILGYFFITEQQSIYLLPVAAGGFLYIAIADLIPEIFKQKKPITIVINLMAIIFGILILISAKLFGG